MRRALRGWGAGVVAALLLAALAYGGWQWLQVSLDQPGPAPTTTRVEVPEGSGLEAALVRLQRAGVVRHARLVELYFRLHARLPRIQAGTYDVAPHASARQVVQQLVEGRVVLDSITVVEGWSFAQMRHALDTDPDIRHEWRNLSDAQLMRALGHPGEPAEGQFFPDTYRFAAGTPDRRIYEMAYARMQAHLATAWAERAPGLPLENSEQALTLASIVEKETALPLERPKVAAVFLNRLRRGMRLQADPTVIYGLGGRYDGTLHTRDLATDTPYNTYTRAGLPPTPIALPGAASLQATLHPADIGALYFVATGQGDGSHRFSDTLAEQDVALRAYLRRLQTAHAAPSGTSTRGAAPEPPAPPTARKAGPTTSAVP